MPAELFGRVGTEVMVRAAAAVVQLAIDGVEFVKAQMENNGGSTLKAAIDRTDALATKTVERLDGIDARVEFLEQIHRKQAEVDKVLAENAAKLDAIRPTLHLPPTTSHQEEPV